MRADIKYLIKEVDGISKNVKNLDCAKNMEIIHVLKREHDKHEVMRQHIAKTIATQILKASGFVVAGATAVYAYFK